MSVGLFLDEHLFAISMTVMGAVFLVTLAVQVVKHASSNDWD